MEPTEGSCVPEDPETTSLPTHVLLCRERYHSTDRRLEDIEGVLKGIRQDFKNATWGALGVALTIIGILVYRFIITGHGHP